MNSRSKTEVFVDTETIIQKVPVFRPVVNLMTLEKYQDRKSIVDALMDDDFSSPGLAKIAAAIQQEDPKERKKTLSFMQRRCSYSDLQKVQRALDDKKCVYDTRNQIFGWKGAKALARCWARRLKKTAEKGNTAKKKDEATKKTSVFFPRKQGRSF